MNRRKFLQLLGLTAPVAAIAPALLLAAPEPELIVLKARAVGCSWTTPLTEFKSPGPGYYKYVRHAFTGGQAARAGDHLIFTDKERMHVIPIYFKPRLPPLAGQAVAISEMREGEYGWVKMGKGKCYVAIHEKRNRISQAGKV